MTIGTDPLECLIEDCILTAHLLKSPGGDEHTVNLLIVGQTGTGKTRLVQQFSGVRGVKESAELTFASLMAHYGPDLLNRNITHLFFPDIGPLINRSPLQSALHQMSLYSQLIEEGIKEWQTMRGLFRSPLAVQCGMIACVTHDAYTKQLQFLASSNGFLSRFLTVSFSHSPALQEYIHAQIDRGFSKNHHRPPLVIPPRPVLVRLPEEISRQIRKPGLGGATLEQRARSEGDTYSYRTHSQLRNILKANALRLGRTTVQREDLADLVTFSQFFGLGLSALDIERP